VPALSGKHCGIEPGFVPGGRVTEGDPLVDIDHTDDERLIMMRRSEFAEIDSGRKIEEGQQCLARREVDRPDAARAFGYGFGWSGWPAGVLAWVRRASRWRRVWAARSASMV